MVRTDLPWYFNLVNHYLGAADGRPRPRNPPPVDTDARFLVESYATEGGQSAIFSGSVLHGEGRRIAIKVFTDTVAGGTEPGGDPASFADLRHPSILEVLESGKVVYEGASGLIAARVHFLEWADSTLNDLLRDPSRYDSSLAGGRPLPCDAAYRAVAVCLEALVEFGSERVDPQRHQARQHFLRRADPSVQARGSGNRIGARPRRRGRHHVELLAGLGSPRACPPRLRLPQRGCLRSRSDAVPLCGRPAFRRNGAGSLGRRPP